MAQIFRKGLFKVLPGSVAILMVLTLVITFWQSMPVNNARAVAGDGATSSIQLLDTVVVNGKIDRITFSIANPNGETWALKGALPYGLSVTYGGVGDVAISSVAITSLATANPVTIQVDLDESDPQLLQNTAASAVELIYTQTSTWNACNTAAENGICDGIDEQMNAIATGDTGATDTEADGAAPYLISATYSDTFSVDGKVDQVVYVFSESTTWNLVADSAFSIAGDINLTGFFAPSECTASPATTYTCTDDGTGTVDADSNETGKQTVGGVEPSFTYTNNSNRINDTINNTATFTKALTDSAVPIVVISDGQAGTVNDADMTVLYTFEFTEAVQNFTTDDVTLNAGGAKGAFTAVDDDTYTLLITATDDSVTNISLTVVKDAFTDLNSNAMAANSTDANQTVDTRNPTVVITDDDLDILNDADAETTYTFEFSEDVTGFTTADVTVTGGAKGLFTATDGNTYTLVVTATDDSVTNISVTVSNADLIDANSNLMAAETADANQTVDTRNPTVTTAIMKDTNGDGQIDRISFTFSENLQDTAAGANGFDVTSVANHGTCNAETADPAVSTSLNLDFSCSSVYTAIGDLTAGFTANAGILDAAGNQMVSTSFTAASSPAITDQAAPVYVSSQTLDNNSNGTVDYVKVTYSEAVLDSSVAAGDFETGIADTTSGNLTESFASTIPSGAGILETDSANDAYLFIGITSSLETISTNKTDYTIKIQQIGAITDAATNSLASFTLKTSTDGAYPILVSATKSLSSSQDVLTFVYSEVMTVTDGASTATKGDITTAGTVAGFGSFGTTGDVTVPTLKNTVSGNGTATISVVLAAEVGGYLNNTSTTEPSGTFTPVAAAALVDAAALQVNAAHTVTAVSGSAWDLVQPTITSVTLADVAGNNGKVDQATIVFSSTMRDANITNGDALLGGGVHSGTFTTGTANDATTVFNLTADTLDVNTAANAAQFTYSGVTTPVTDLAGNLLNTATDGVIVDADATEIDGASPVLTTVVLSNSGTRNRVSFTYSEAMYVTNDASTTATGDVTSVGTVAGLGDFATNGDVTVTTLKNTISGNGTTTIYVDLAGEFYGYLDGTSTTEPSGDVSPLASAGVLDAVGRQTNTSGAAVAPSGGASWDLTKPTIASVTISDQTGNGKIDRAVVVFDEAVHDGYIWHDEATLGGEAGTFTTGTANDTTTTFNLTSDSALTIDTSATAAGFLYTGASVKIVDLAGNLLNTTTDGTIVAADVVETDGANPIIKTFTYLDGDGDGKIDQITAAYSETVAAGSVLRANDLTLTNVGDFTAAAFGTNTTDLITGSVASTTVTLGTEATAVDTADASGTIAITSQYAFSLTDGTNTNTTLGAQTNATFVDDAAPVVSSVTPADSATNISRSASLVITFSEPMATTFNEDTQYDVTTDPGDFTKTWSSSNSVVTLAHALQFGCTATVAVTTAEATILAADVGAKALVTTGPSDGDWSFTTASCGSTGGGGGGSSTATSTTPVVTLTSPDGGESLTGGEVQNVTWTTSGSGMDTVGIYYSADNGSTYNLVAYNLNKSLGTYAWTLPNIDSETVLVKIIAYDSGKGNLDSDVSTAFEISAVSEETIVDEEETPAEEATTTDDEGRTVAIDSGETGPSPVTGEDEAISTVVTGQYIRGYSFNTIYYIDENNERRPFWDSNTFFTYADSFDEVVWVTDATLPTMTLGAPMLPKVGVVLVKIQSDPKVYAIDTGDVLRWVPTEEVAISLYGSAWADYVIDLEPTTFARFTVGDDMAESDLVDLDIMKTRMELAALAQ
jgi:hypothetical protein